MHVTILLLFFHKIVKRDRREFANYFFSRDWNEIISCQSFDYFFLLS